MATLDTAFYSDALKVVYMGPIVQQFYREGSPLYKMLPKTTKYVQGTKVQIPILIGGNGGVGSRSENALLPSAGRQNIEDLSVQLSRFYGSIELTNEVMVDSRTNTQAFERALDVEIQGVIQDSTDMIGRQLWNDGTPILAQVVLPATGGFDFDWDNSNHPDVIREGYVVDFYNDTSGTTKRNTAGQGNGVTIATVEYLTDGTGRATITGGLPGGVVNNDFFVIEDAFDGVSGGSNTEATGLAGAIGDTTTGLTTYLGQSAATVSSWRSFITDAAPSPPPATNDLTDQLIQSTLDDIERRGGDYPDCIFSSYGVRNVYVQATVSDRRWIDLDRDMGWSALAYTGGSHPIPFLVDRWAPLNQAFLINKKHFNIHHAGPISWLDEDGAVLSRVAGRAAYGATLYYYFQPATRKRAAHGRIINLNEA